VLLLASLGGEEEKRGGVGGSWRCLSWAAVAARWSGEPSSTWRGWWTSSPWIAGSLLLFLRSWWHQDFFFDQGNRRGGLYGNFLLMTKKITGKEAWGIYMSGGEEGRSYTRKTKFKKDQSTQIRLLCVWV
jgi:hypothetical protein